MEELEQDAYVRVHHCMFVIARGSRIPMHTLRARLDARHDEARDQAMRGLQHVQEEAIRRGINGGLLDASITDFYIAHTRTVSKDIGDLYWTEYAHVGLTKAQVRCVVANAATDIEREREELAESLDAHVREPSSRTHLKERFARASLLAEQDAVAALTTRLEALRMQRHKLLRLPWIAEKAVIPLVLIGITAFVTHWLASRDARDDRDAVERKAASQAVALRNAPLHGTMFSLMEATVDSGNQSAARQFADVLGKQRDSLQASFDATRASTAAYLGDSVLHRDIAQWAEVQHLAKRANEVSALPPRKYEASRLDLYRTVQSLNAEMRTFEVTLLRENR